ncbi:hypothetical protein ACTA71_005538 [Dictyostelium dimigraforme]
MKFLAVLCIIFFTVAFSYANHYGCYNNSPCGAGRICYTSKGSCNCIEISHCLDVTLESTMKSEWDFNGTHYSQYDVQIHNHDLTTDISSIFIGVNPGIAASDFTQIWNARRLENGEFTLAYYQTGIPKNTTSNFGFIKKGFVNPDMAIFAVTY